MGEAGQSGTQRVIGIMVEMASASWSKVNGGMMEMMSL